jgi:hypothetical protein
MATEWSREAWEKSLSARCWWYTPLDVGVTKSWPKAEKNGELREILQMEQALGDVPAWAAEIVQRCINFAPPCGHHRFPEPFLQTLDSIGAEKPPFMVHSCFCVDGQRKHAMMDYCLCLDAWLAEAQPDVPARELNALGSRKVDWTAVCRDLWQVLGDRTELKELLVTMTLRQQRYWIKTTQWDDDFSTAFGRDEYVADFVGKKSNKVDPALRRPDFDPCSAPRWKREYARLEELTPHSKWFRTVIWDFSWLCAPKAFRYLEKTLWCMGKERPVINLPSFPLANPEDVPGFLQCEDTYPDQDAAARWWSEFCGALESWWRGQSVGGAVALDVSRRLGTPSPAKCWLVRLFLRKLRMLAENKEQFASLVDPPSDRRRGRQTIARNAPT